MKLVDQITQVARDHGGAVETVVRGERVDELRFLVLWFDRPFSAKEALPQLVSILGADRCERSHARRIILALSGLKLKE